MALDTELVRKTHFRNTRWQSLGRGRGKENHNILLKATSQFGGFSDGQTKSLLQTKTLISPRHENKVDFLAVPSN